MCATLTSKRAGFTLIEMLVVVIIIVVLATIAVAITPRIAGEQKLSKGADQVQGWLLIAKSRAKRDQIPTGVRLIPDTANPLHVRELQYVQQPDDFVGGKDLSLPVQNRDPLIGQIQATGNTASLKPDPKNADFWGGFGPAAPQIWPVQEGDYLELSGGGPVHRIQRVQQYQLVLLSPVSNNVPWTGDWRVIRKPRVLIGETPMLLAQDIVIDKSTNAHVGYGPVPLPPVNADGSIDIMFSPSGSMMNFGSGNKSFVPLWIRDVTADVPDPVNLPGMGGDPIIVCIYKRAGFIAAHPVDKNPPNPYSFVTDGKSSGL